MTAATYLTKEKHVALTDELDHLKNERRQEIAQKLDRARSLGDLSENAEYHEARSAQAEIEDRIREIEHVLKTATIVTHKKGTMIEVGSTVTLCKVGTKNERTYEIVGSQEADMAAGRISHTSPLGAALLGKEQGTKFTFTAPSGITISYNIVKVE
jgi:transcription elongation factor GreA